MAAISLRNADNVVFRRCHFINCDKAIEAIDSKIMLDRVDVRRCGIGLDLVNSQAAVQDSMFFDNAIDIVVNKSTAFVMNTVAQRILEILPKGDYRINPYTTEHLVNTIINTRDVHKKRVLLGRLLNTFKIAGYGWTVYQIIKEVLRLVS